MAKTGRRSAQKAGVFTGKWQTEGTFENGTKARSELECRWSPQKRYLVCEQDVSTWKTTLQGTARKVSD